MTTIIITAALAVLGTVIVILKPIGSLLKSVNGMKDAHKAEIANKDATIDALQNKISAIQDLDTKTKEINDAATASKDLLEGLPDTDVFNNSIKLLHDAANPTSPGGGDTAPTKP